VIRAATLALLVAGSAAQVQVGVGGVPVYPYPYRYQVAGPESNLRIIVTPKIASVFVDGYFAGEVDQFDGVFQRLHVSPGSHEFAIYLAGYHTMRQTLFLNPNETLKISGTLERLGEGQPNEPVPMPAPPTARADMPRMPSGRGRGRSAEPPPQSPAASTGAIALRVRPAGADIRIDGAHWAMSSDAGEPMVIQVQPGRHTVEIHESDFRGYVTDIEVRPGETVPLNVSLTPEH
jgi:hypothetical protein